MQFTLDKNPSKIFLFNTCLLLIIPCRKATNSAGPGARQSATDSAQHVLHYIATFHIKLLSDGTDLFLIGHLSSRFFVTAHQNTLRLLLLVGTYFSTLRYLNAKLSTL